MFHENANPGARDAGAARGIGREQVRPIDSEVAATGQVPSNHTVPALDIFIARCEARAKLWQVGELSLHDAVDALQAAAVRSGLVTEIGQDHVQAIMAEAFAALRDDQGADGTLSDVSGDYDGSTFAAACQAADEKQAARPSDPHIEKLRQLMDDKISLERAWREINAAHLVGRAANFTVEAVMLGLRERGTAALREPKVRDRLAQLSEAQLIEVGDRLQRLKPEIACAWSADDVGALVSTWEEVR
jgi:hypothetical protein